jgi:hypothetical protein
VLFSSGRDTHPDPWGFYMGLVTIGWGASATYESVTGVVSVLSPACFAAFFVGTYSAAIVFLPVNLATGALCGEGHLHEGPQSDAKDHAVAWQFATSAFLVLVGAGVCTWGLSVPCHHCFFLLLARTPLLPSARRLLMHTNYSVPPPPLLSLAARPRTHVRTHLLHADCFDARQPLPSPPLPTTHARMQRLS